MTLHVVHHVDYAPPPPTRGTFRFDKYRLVMEELRSSGHPLTEHAPEPMPRAWLEAVHCPDYVDQVLRAEVPADKERRIGFPVTARIAARVQHTNGGTYLAALLAGRSAPEAVRFAHGVASEVVRHPGALIPLESLPRLG